jgi:hypothetical protein
MAPEFRQMRHVLVLAELGSFARADAVLHLSQSALSGRIQGAKEQVGAALFLPIRSSRWRSRVSAPAAHCFVSVTYDAYLTPILAKLSRGWSG